MLASEGRLAARALCCEACWTQVLHNCCSYCAAVVFSECNAFVGAILAEIVQVMTTCLYDIRCPLFYLGSERCHLRMQNSIEDEGAVKLRHCIFLIRSPSLCPCWLPILLPSCVPSPFMAILLPSIVSDSLPEAVIKRENPRQCCLLTWQELTRQRRSLKR